VVKVVLKTWHSCGVHGELGAPTCSRGLGAEPPVGSSGKASDQEVREQSPLKLVAF